MRRCYHLLFGQLSLHAAKTTRGPRDTHARHLDRKSEYLNWRDFFLVKTGTSNLSTCKTLRVLCNIGTRYQWVNLKLPEVS